MKVSSIESKKEVTIFSHVLTFFQSENMPCEALKKIDILRNDINKIDSTVLSLLQKRLVCAREIGQLKRECNQKREDIQREEAIIQRLLAENDQFLPEKTVTTIFAEIIDVCKRLQ